MLQSKPMAASVADHESFIDLLRAACDDRQMNHSLEQLLSVPDAQRHRMLETLVAQLRDKGAPEEFVKAVACLADDAVSERAYAVIFACQRPDAVQQRGAWWVGAAILAVLLGTAAALVA